MIDEGTRDQFAVRFYRWSVETTIREVSEGFPLVGLVNGQLARSVIDYFYSIRDADKMSAARRLVKRSHPRGAELCGESMTDAEKGWYEAYRLKVSELSSAYLNEIVLPSRKRANKRALRAAVKAVLPAICGDIVQRDSASLWVHARAIGTWTVLTEVDLGGSPIQLSYHHYIARSTNDADRLGGLISLLVWMGISMTEWDLVSESEESSAAQALGRICEHFMNAVPSLLDGLS
jgi:hypothetical protein